jgi:adenosylcobinamide kinase/adenosylcobinamide-phosphate guanylyltransferase
MGVMYTFVTGGYRSGRSNYALRRASELGPPPWLYVTAGEETDEAIRKRIERHRRDKEAIWRTAIMPPDLRGFLDPKLTEGLGALVLDGFMDWLAARLGSSEPSADPALLEEIEALADRMYRVALPIILVTMEVGMAAMPEGAAAQRFLKVAASANQILAGNAGAVVMMVSGVPLKVR